MVADTPAWGGARDRAGTQVHTPETRCVSWVMCLGLSPGVAAGDEGSNTLNAARVGARWSLQEIERHSAHSDLTCDGGSGSGHPK